MTKPTKYIFILAAALLATMTAAAQSRLGVTAGASLSTLKFKQDIVPIHGIAGAHAGGQLEMMFPGIGFGLDMGLIYNMAGAKVDLGDRLMWQDQGYGDETVRLHQLNIPLHLRFKYTKLNGLEDFVAPFVYGGPEFDITLAHSKCDAISFATGDVALTAGIGAEFYKRWQLSASYSWGMTYTLKAKILQDYSANNRQWTVRLSYFF